MRRFFLAPLVLAFALAVSVRAADPADTTPPTLVSATRYTTNMYQVHVTFSERIDTNSVFQATNYRIRTLSGSPVRTLTAVIVETNTSVTPRSTTNVVATFAEELDLNRDWGLYVARLSDTNDNVMVGTNSVVIRTVSTLIPREGEWYRRDDAYYPEFAQFRFTDNSWAQIDYDYESQFLFGLAGFYLGVGGTPPPNGNTTLCCYPNEVDTASTTAYYRTKFNVIGSLFNSTFAVKYFIDDGAIVYLNGKEVWRTNISAAITAPTYRTLASASGALSWRPTTGLLTLPAFNNAVVEGVNHLAVEVHQRTAADGTAGFGLELVQTYTNRVGGPVSIVRHPISLTNVVEGTTATFDVLPDGKAPFKYKWFLVGADGKTNTIADATNRVLSIKPVPLAYNGAKVFVEVIGAASATVKAVSSNATLSVIPDVGAPSIVSAIYEEDTEGITLTFSESMKLSSALDKANYTLTNQLGEVIAINTIEDIDGQSILIKPAAPLTAGARYTLLPRNLTDNAGVANALNNGLAVQVGGVFTLIPFASEWHYYQQGTNPPVGVGWQTKAYVENNRWEVGNGLFYNEDEEVPLPSKNILLNLSDVDGNRLITYYFRKTFDFRGATNGVRLTYGHVVDDGIVVWLNGQIAARFGMTGTPTYTSFATDRAGDASLTNGITFALTNIVQGENQIAVELHQSSATSSDVVFDLELLANIPSTITTNVVVLPPVKLSVSIANGNAVITWPTPPVGSVLESTTSLSPASWQTVAGATSPYSAPLSGANNKARYYRLRQP
ncbi:MAG: Ig-like domain-containing protein [Verrucomicrobiales bacterium]|nr:Ig-like domain-containing protein [Verrucomicrobiales bacterium]